jgi:hypothetical protein
VSVQPLPDPDQRVTAAGAQWAAIAAHAPAVASTMAATWPRWPRSSPRPAWTPPTSRCASSLATSPTTNPTSTPSRPSTATSPRTTKVWLTAQPGQTVPRLSVNTRRQRLGMLRAFFERIIEWDWPDAPARGSARRTRG